MTMLGHTKTDGGASRTPSTYSYILPEIHVRDLIEQALLKHGALTSIVGARGESRGKRKGGKKVSNELHGDYWSMVVVVRTFVDINVEVSLILRVILFLSF